MSKQADEKTASPSPVAPAGRHIHTADSNTERGRRARALAVLRESRGVNFESRTAIEFTN